MKNTLKLLLAGMMTISLSACGTSSTGSSTTTTSAEKVKLVIYQNKAEVTEPMQNYADTWGKANNAEVTIKTCTGSCDYGQGMKSDIAAGEAPDVFVIEGDSGYSLYSDMMAPMDDASWLDNTSYEYVKDGHVYGMPVAVEGYGLAYNADVLEKAGIDPTTLTNLTAYKEAFEKIDSMKDELGLTATVALNVADGSYWVMGNHDFSAYLSSGLGYDDTTIVDKVNAGEVDAARLSTYADWVELLFNYSDKTLLIGGTNDEAVAQFGAGKFAFLHQGTWADQPVSEAGGEFNMGFAPYAPLGDTETNGLFAGAPSWYCLNKDSANIDLAKKFLEDLAGDAGQKMMVENVGLISAFTTCSYKPAGALASALSAWIEAGGTTYNFTNQYKTPDGFSMNTLGPIYNQFASGGIDKATFIQMFTDAVAGING